MVEGLNSCMLNEGSGICDNTTGSTADMFINFEYFLNAFWDDES